MDSYPGKYESKAATSPEAPVRRLASTEERFSFIVEASLALAGMDGREETRTTAVHMAFGAMGDYCYLDLAVPLSGNSQSNGGRPSIERFALGPPGAPNQAAESHEMRCHYPSMGSPVRGTLRVIRTGLEELEADPGSEILSQIAPDPDHRRLLEQLGAVSYLGVPLRVRRKTVGAMGFVATTGSRPHTQDDLQVARGLATFTGLSLASCLPELTNVGLAQEAAYLRMYGQRTLLNDLPDALPSLTRRQREVLDLMAHGSTTAQMARAMGVSEDTAYKHVRAIVKALGAKTRAEAVSRAVSLGMAGQPRFS